MTANRPLLDRLVYYRNDLRWRKVRPPDEEVVELVDEAIRAIRTLHNALLVANESYRLERSGWDPAEDDSSMLTRRM